ncbi:MAG: hypothetical protein N0C84_03200 [Candidatus Thiodiazotropha taylori]|uniref:Uncharacterized protein n=1 Tax=Candidatus Thiodiazotropha taylori TaxID=2792791 RepID=A0A9E4K9I0_9GAMM|nr:hypothetical protein [Candidatus Thiodiazotropha taylori]MCG7945331.1 hypothetical protein [Candidatus Thiodiazotropha taylori]MCW4255445.1 hypothetical protein [Candidatus Thiodiazotropha taylori]MCW4255455.1 hypothetical protein [Candidatus Thiodiazotropha taylori]
MTLLVQNSFNQGRYNNYLVGGNICNAFALGNLGSSDDFFIVGAEPPGESNYPLLTGNILDSEGNILFRLVQNMLILNPGKCSKILSDHIGYEIHDGNGEFIFQVSTRFTKPPGSSDECFVTTITGNFFNKNGEMVFKAHSGDNEEYIESNVKSVFGFSGGFGFVQAYENDELTLAKAMLGTGGKIHRVLTGPIKNEEVTLDGSALFDVEIDNCKINVSTGEFVVLGGQIKITNNQFNLTGPAQNIKQLIEQLG